MPATFAATFKRFDAVSFVAASPVDTCQVKTAVTVAPASVVEDNLVLSTGLIK